MFLYLRVTKTIRLQKQKEWVTKTDREIRLQKHTESGLQKLTESELQNQLQNGLQNQLQRELQNHHPFTISKHSSFDRILQRHAHIIPQFSSWSRLNTA